MKPKALFVMLILWLSFTTIQARSTEDVPDKGTYAKFLLVGCYMKPDEEGVRMYRFDGQTADVDYPCGLRGISNPAFLTSDSTGNRIYAIGDDEGKSSTANALLFDKESGLLSLLNSQSTDGELPIYITLSPKEYFVLTANYTATQKGVKKCLSGSGCCSAQNGALSTVFFHAAGDLWRVYRSGGALWM